MLITFFVIKSTVHFEFIPQGQTVKKAYYVEILSWLHEAVHAKRHKLRPNDWILHHNNDPAHKVLVLCQQFLAQKLITEVEHPPYSPDLALNDFWLFQK